MVVVSKSKIRYLGIVDGRWSRWSPWSSCTRTCGTGKKLRERSCDNPKPANGGKDCQGEQSKTRECNNKPCECLCGQKKNFAKVIYICNSLLNISNISKSREDELTSVGGEEAEVNEFPWAALLLLRSSETNETDRCGGTLISDRHVLTAGHCLRKLSDRGEVNFVWDDITVVLGEIEITRMKF